jgi:DNA-binding LytR/AlgR family response regulator
LINQSIIETLKIEKNELQFHAMQLAGDIGLLYNSNEPLSFDSQEFKSVKNTLSVKKKDGTFLLKVEDIIYFQAQGDFVFACDNTSNKHIINDSLKNINKRVFPDSFFQINRNELVNFNYITKFKSYTKNRLEISVLNSNDILYTSNSKTPIFRDWIDSH